MIRLLPKREKPSLLTSKTVKKKLTASDFAVTLGQEVQPVMEKLQPLIDEVKTKLAADFLQVSVQCQLQAFQLNYC